MVDREQPLSVDQRSQILGAFVRRDLEFLDTCIKALDGDGRGSPAFYSDMYEKLAKRECSKIEALEHLLVELGFGALLPSPTNEIRYDLNHFLSFSPGNEARFVSMLIDFVSDRAPNPDEALHLEHLLMSGRASRRQLLEQVAARYADRMLIQGGDILLRVTSTHTSKRTICERWRGRPVFHPDLVKLVSFDERKGGFVSGAGMLFFCDLTLDAGQEWGIRYKIRQSGSCLIKVEVLDSQSGDTLSRIEISGGLSGWHTLPIENASSRLRVAVSCLQDELKCPSFIDVAELVLQQLKG